MEIEHPVLKIFPTVEGRSLEIARLHALKEKIKVFLCHEVVPQENLQTGKKIATAGELVNYLAFKK